jgi:hypothetical protein
MVHKSLPNALNQRHDPRVITGLSQDSQRDVGPKS